MKMKYLLLSAGLLTGVCASAHDVPKVEVPVGFSFVNVHPDQPAITSFNVFGGGVGVVFNLSPVIGLKGDFMGYTQGTGQRVTENGEFLGNVSGNLFTYMFGPQLKKHSGKIQPFGEALFGGAHTNLDANLCEVEGTCASGTGSNNGFAMEFGVGLDIPITKSIQFRPVEVDYLYTHFGSNHIAGASAARITSNISPVSISPSAARLRSHRRRAALLLPLRSWREIRYRPLSRRRISIPNTQSLMRGRAPAAGYRARPKPQT